MGTDPVTSAVDAGATAAGIAKTSVKLDVSKDAVGNEFDSVTALSTATMVLEVTNSGTAAATDLVVSETAKEFSISAIECGSELRAGLSCKVTLSFTPSAEAAYAATLRADFRNELGESKSVLYPLIGTGVARPASVEALYPSHGKAWNDYVKNDGANVYSATDTACTGSESGNYFTACIHGGEKRKVSASLLTSCDDLTFEDALGAFDWFCEIEGGSVVLKTKKLKSGKSLSDLVTASGWISNQVTIRKEGKNVYQTPAEKWWGNTVSTSLTTILEKSRIYVIGSNVTRSTPSTASDKTAVVILPGAKVTFTGNSNRTFITATEKKFFWFEGEVTTGTANAAFRIGQNAFFHRFENVKINGFLTGIELSSGVTTSGKHFLRNVVIATTSAPQHPGIYVLGNVFDSIFTQIKIAGYESCVNDTAIRSVYNNIHCIGNDSHNRNIPAMTMSSTSTIISQAFFTNTSAHSIGPPNGGASLSATVLGATAIRSHSHGGSHAGHLLLNFSNSTAYHIVGMDMAFALSGYMGDGNEIGQVAVDRSRSLAEAIGNGNHLKGYALLGHTLGFDYSNDGSLPCWNEVTATASGFNNQCQSTDGIDLISGVSLTSSFVGELTTNDIKNTSDTGSDVAFSTTMDFINYENFWRSWGKAYGQWGNPNFFNAGGGLSNERDGWGFFSCDSATGKLCTLWDWRLKASDTVLRNKSGNGRTNNEPFVPGETCPSAAHGNNTVTDQVGRTFLVNAIEIIGDQMGDDNSLCESNEACYFMPNIGSYQGEGELLDACEFEDGTVTGVTLHAYETNGV